MIQPENRLAFERAELFAGNAASLGRETYALNCAHDFRGQGWPRSQRAAQFAYKPIAVFGVKALAR